MKYLKFTIGILIVLSASRFIPHPPNFTSLIALSFYIPAVLGFSYIPALLVSFFLTDLIIGLHALTFFTWGSVIIIGLISKYFNKGIILRVFGSVLGSVIFFVVTNFGVWLLGTYSHTLEGFIVCYTLAIPFFIYSLISTLLFSSLIETILRFSKISFWRSV